MEAVPNDTSHNSESRPSKRRRASGPGKCFEFVKTGVCRRGDQCKFKHGPMKTEKPSAGTQPKGTNVAQSNVNSRDVAVIVQHTDTNVKEVPKVAVSPSSGIHMTTRRFSDMPVSPPLIRAIENTMGYQTLTRVQAESLDVILSGRDCLARAKTGTGKTLAFLIPAVEAMLRLGKHQQRDVVSTLILSPTRELANQIAAEAIALLTFVPNQRVVSLTGGTNRKADVRALNSGAIAVLVATPGRLQDHLQNTAGFGDRCGRLATLVFDEADTLLDMGFKPAIDLIMTFMPRKEDRQTLLFSATVPPAVRQIAKTSLKADYQFVDTVGDDEEQTHQHVNQTVVTVAMEDLWASAFTAIIQAINASSREHKIIVFCTTARLAGYMADLFRLYLGSGSTATAAVRTTVLEIHSRKSQAQRTKTSDLFRDGRAMVLFSSDVSARGMDYPDVTFVLQVGLTDKEQYVHRLGRTARAGKGGKGMILLHDFEETYMLKQLKEMPLTSMQGDALGITEEEFRALQAVTASSLRVDDIRKGAEQSYQAWLGFYNSHLRVLGWDKPTLVVMANRFASTIGFPEGSPPALQAKTVGKMGLKGVPGLRVDKTLSVHSNGSRKPRSGNR